MAEILKFPDLKPSKFGYKKAKTVRKGKKIDPELYGQLNLFSKPAQVFHLTSNLTPFEEALMYDEMNNEKAAELYRKAIAQKDSVADAYCNLGIIESKKGNTAEAFDCFTKSLKVNPRHFESHFNLANLYFDEGDFKLAELHYNLAKKFDTDFPNLFFNLGLVQAVNREFDAAINSFQTYKNMVSDEEEKKADELLKNLKQSLATPN